MRRDDIIRTLQEHRDELTQRYGVKSLALFGSVARDEATDASDVDLLVEFDDRPVGLFHLGGLQHRLQEILGVEKLDLVMRRAIFPALRDNILGEAVDVLGTEVGASH
jgi:predicted nucleotidyltransferase